MLRKTANSVLLVAIVLASNGCFNTETPNIQTQSKPEQSAVDDQDKLALEESVKKLDEINTQIRNGLASDDPHSAHEPLHQVGHVLEEISKLAEKVQGEFSHDQFQAVEKSIDELFTAFGNIDKTFHGEDGSTYDEETEAIQKAMSVIQEAVEIKGK